MRKSITQKDIVKAFSQIMPKFVTLKEAQVKEISELLYNGDMEATRQFIVSHALRTSIDMLYKEMHKNDENFKQA